ncbi:MAG: COR domain-containing protein [Ardenticatenaceae bacterium]
MNDQELLQIIEQAIKDGATELNLFTKGVTELPLEIGKLTSLTTLYLGWNQLINLRPEIGRLTNLTRLDLTGNQLINLPPEIGQLTNLTTLDLCWNQGINLPPDFFKLKNLTTLNLSCNQLSTLPPEIDQLTNLTDLDLSGNKLINLPPEMGKLTNLTTLCLSHDRLSTLPSVIEQLANLTTLNLSGNKLINLPPEVRQLTNLTTLDLSENQLRALSPEIGQLTNLRRLDLSGNQLRALPPEIGQLTNLVTLELDGNPLPIPPEILSRTNEPATIIEYYLGENKKPLNEAKLVFVGQGRVGKTSLVKGLVDNQFDEQEPITEGIAIKEWSVTVNQTEIKLNIWDFGGQEIMHATHQFFMTKRTLYLLVLDAQQGQAGSRIDYWLKLIQSFGKDSPIIVISNKSDLDQLFLNQKELGEKYPTIKAFVDTSCKSGKGIAELQKHITAIMGELEHVQDEIPLTWLAIKAELERLEHDYISYRDYVQLCEAKQIDQKEEQRILIRLLHDLGVVLNFEDDPRLSDTSVLNPAWVTGGVYKIINAKQVMQNRGVLEIGQLDDILDDRERYPREMHLFVIDLMRKFELCFEFEGHTEEKFLIPDLLSEEEPPLKWSADGLNFEYRYDFLPGSVISRFMVRMNLFIFHHTRWRHGMMLVYNKNTALVKAVSEHNRIRISIVGPLQDRWRFWKMIYEQFDSIHKTIKGVNAQGKLLVAGHLGFNEIEAASQLVKPEWVTQLKNDLEEVRLRVHPQEYYPTAFLLGQWYYEQLRDYTQARQALVKAHEAISAWRSLIREEADERHKQLSSECVSLYEMLVHCYLVEGDKRKAFEYASIGKGRAFVNTLARSRFDFENLPAEKADFLPKLEEIRQTRRDIDYLDTDSSLHKDKRRGKQDVLLREEAQLWREMERKHPLLTATLTVPTLSVAQACALAQELDATLVEYYRHDGREGTPRWCAFVISKDADAKEAVRYVPLPEVTSDFLVKMLEWRNDVHLSMGRSRFADKRFAELYEAAVDPLALKDDKRVVIAPFERLHLLPLSAACNPETGRYFSEAHTLSFVPCLTALYVVNEESKTRAQASKEAQERVERLLSVAYPGPHASRHYLPNVLEEARALVERLPKVTARRIVVTPLHEEEATPENVIKKAPDHHVIHFGCHGSFKSNQPEQSGLRLAHQKAAASAPHGPYLTIQRIITELHLKQTRLATLAACLTGEVALRDGEEHVGLLQAMMTAGAQTVVASLWRVDDAATRALFEAFYFREANIHCSAHAMKDASRLLRQQKKWTHPYYWAAFEVNGLTSRYQETTPPQWPEELLNHIKQDHERSIPRGVVMDDKLILANAEVLLKQMVEYHDEISAALEQRPLPDQIAKLPIEPTKVGLAKALLAMVANHPTLGADFPEIQGHFRHIDDQEQQQTAGIPHSLQKAGAGQNKMYDLRKKSIDILKHEYIKRPAKGQPSLLDQFWALLWKK